MYYIGIDLGTSSVKLLLLSKNGIAHTVTKRYECFYPQAGWSEQNPEDWYLSTVEGLKELTADIDKNRIGGISFGGQMHGLVLLDAQGTVLRPAILWNDARAAIETQRLNALGRDFLVEHTGNIAFAGFTAPKLLWVKENEPKTFAKIRKILLPKDYLAYRFTGVYATDVSDASGTLLFDVKNRRWSEEMLRVCNVAPEWLPAVYESAAPVGALSVSLRAELGFPAHVRVIIGAGDNAAAAVGMGTVRDNDCNISLGTSGTLFVACDTYKTLENNAIHFFAHANGKYHMMACILSAASASGWWLQKILNIDDFLREETAIGPLGENDVFFLPYLSGERSPHNDPYARGAFVGLSVTSTRSALYQAVLEGVAFALCDNLRIMRRAGVSVTKATVCGGGAKNATWLRILANTLNVTLETNANDQGPSLGAAILAATGCGEENFIHNVSSAQPPITVIPEPGLTRLYAQRYETFQKIYPALKTVYRAE